MTVLNETSQDSSPLMRAILHALLDRFEQPDRQQTVRVRLTRAQHAPYFAADDATDRLRANAEATQLAAAGILTLRWQRWEEGNWLEAVDLIVDGAPRLYALLGRVPRGEQEGALRQLIATQSAIPGWHGDFLSWASDQLARHHTPLPLDRADLHESAALLRALHGIAALDRPTLERTLSTRLFGDSKRLAALLGGVLRVLRRHAPEAALLGDDDQALLQLVGVARTPEYVPIAGPLSFAAASPPLPERQIDLAAFEPSVALPAPLLRRASQLRTSARALVTVENLTSFTELAGVRPPDLLAIYTGGFASPTVIALLAQIRGAHPALPFWHWGDLDAGGLRILAHLRSQISHIGALAMQPSLLMRYASQTQPLTTSDRAALQSLSGLEALSDCTELIDAMLTLNRKLEQEALSAAEIVALR